MKKLIKIIEGEDLQLVEKQVNEFNNSHSVFATQSHVNVDWNPGTTLYTFVLFYNEE